MIALLTGIGDYLLADVPRPLALVLRLPVLTFTAYCVVWTTVRGCLRVAAVGLPPIARLATHALWYVLLMPEACLSKRAVKRNRTPAVALYVYGDQIEHLAITARTAFRYLGRLLVSISCIPNYVLVWMSLAWAVVSLITG
jgi:hypothetical protein